MTDKLQILQQLNTDIKLCKACPLYKEREQPSISKGDPKSPLFIIGDIPSSTDHRDATVFSGRTGKSLDSALEDADIKPENTYMTNLIKCYSGNSFFPENDAPVKCFGFLKCQLAAVKPLIVVLCGEQAINWVLLRGSKSKFDNIDNWMGKTYRRKAIYESLRFVAIPSHRDISRLSTEQKTNLVETLKIAKKYIVAKQQSGVMSDIINIDIHEKPQPQGKQIEIFKWKKPTPPDAATN